MKRHLEPSQPQPRHAAGSVRFAEKRRTGTCQFADRVAKISINKYKSCVPASFRDAQKQTCIATIVAHIPESLVKQNENRLQVMSLGVGTKFLPEKMLRDAEESNRDKFNLHSKGYGSFVRDCHAEVLARRAFRRQLCLEIQKDMNSKDDGVPPLHHPILQRVVEGDNIRYRLLPGVTLHMYTSSAPCGNATLKKFTKMDKETYNDKLGPDEWPTSNHEPIPPHSLRLGQFALLTKKDNSKTLKASWRKLDKEKSGESGFDERMICQQIGAPVKGKVWPANQSDEWCPPGTSIVSFDKGSLHSCSDKLCRWNYLGLQGGLISSLLHSPLYMESLTVGRKFTERICRRAVCCRALPPKTYKPDESSKYSLKHPSIMGTAVYMDESGMIDMSNSTEFGQDVRFNSTLCWCWWASLYTQEAECVDGATGLAKDYMDDYTQDSRISMVSTSSLLELFNNTISLLPQHDGEIESPQKSQLSLEDLRSFKRHIAPEYESTKDILFTKHRIFRQWRRRENEGNIRDEVK